MSILITGASGFVSLNLIEALLRQERAVFCFGPVGPPAPAQALFEKLPGRLNYLPGDVSIEADVAAAFAAAKPTRVIHGAALTIAGDKEAGRMAAGVAVNTLGSVHVLDTALRAGVARFVHLSSASVYGANSYGPGPLDEETTIPLPESLYAVTKYAGERLALRYRDQGLNVVVPRLSAVFGAWEYATGVRDTLSGPHQATVLALKGEAAVMPRPGPTDWVYGREVADAVITLMDRDDPSPSVVNVGHGGAGWTVTDWCAKLQTLFPDFDYREDPAAPTVSYHGGKDREPLDVSRLADQVGYQPIYDLDRAFDDYALWLDEYKSLIAAE